jgi:glycerophosphoryl diester phosphodiesterase
MRLPLPSLLVPLVALAAACAGRPDERAFAVIGHRGASWDAPEHTFASWDRALAAGADWLEFDLQRTADSVLVVLHDETLDRTARGDSASCTGLVRERTLEEIRRCDAGRWFNERHPDRADFAYVGLRIPTFDEILERYGATARLYIELKDPTSDPGMERQVFDALTRHGLIGPGVGRDRLLIQSFIPAGLIAFHALAPDVPLVQLMHDSIPAAELDAALTQVATYAKGLGPNHRLVDARLVTLAHAKGLVVHPYTVNDEARMAELVALGVDGLFTDRPDRLRALLRAR